MDENSTFPPKVTTQSTRMSLVTLDGVAYHEASTKSFCHRILANYYFDLAMGIVILTNLVVMVYETDTRAPCLGSAMREGREGRVYCDLKIANAFNHVFLAIYTLEVVLRLYVLRWSMFSSGWNVLDIFIVAAGYVDVAILKAAEASGGIPGFNMGIFRMIRALRILRTVRVFQRIPELYSMMRSFISAVRSMLWGFVMILIILVMFGILAVQFIHPISIRMEDEFCVEAFSQVWSCVLVFFQALVAGDSWGRCAIPVIKAEWATSFIFAGALMCVQLGFMNLILAAIVENAAAAREADMEEKVKMKHRTKRKATQNILKMLQELDADESGTISLDEFMEGYDKNAEMQRMFVNFDMSRDDVKELFGLLDIGDEHELTYEDLVENLRTIENDDIRKCVTMLRLQSAETVRMNKKMYEQMHELLLSPHQNDKRKKNARRSRLSLGPSLSMPALASNDRQTSEQTQNSDAASTPMTPLMGWQGRSEPHTNKMDSILRGIDRLSDSFDVFVSQFESGGFQINTTVASTVRSLDSPHRIGAQVTAGADATQHLNDPVRHLDDQPTKPRRVTADCEADNRRRSMNAEQKLAAMVMDNHLEVQIGPGWGEVSL